MIERKRITAITINHRRPASSAKIEQLAESIEQIGLLNPITVSDWGVLVAGLHRLEACKKLGWTEIPCNVIKEDDAELAEIDENLIRNELTTLERGELLARRKEIYEERHPETKAVNEKGGPGRGNKTNEMISPVLTPAFAADTAAKTGLTPRSIQQEVQIAKNIAPEVKESIRETPIADRKTDLLQLARMEPQQQKQIVSQVSSGAAKTISQAVKQQAESDPELKRIDREHHIQNMVLKSLVICASAGIGDYDEAVEIYLRWSPDWTTQECADRAAASIAHLEKLKAAFTNARKLRAVK